VLKILNMTSTSAVKAELEEYLASNNLKDLFTAIVEALLVEKPSKPIMFMMQYLKVYRIIA